MQRTLPYRPRFNAPPNAVPPSAAPAPGRRAVVSMRFWWLLGGLLLLAGLSRAAFAQATGRAPRARDHASYDAGVGIASADSAWSRLALSYYDSTFRGHDWGAVGRQLHSRAAAAGNMAEVRDAIEAMFATLGESHFALIPSDAVASWSEAPEEGKALGDVGLELRLLDGEVIVSRVVAASPADLAGVHAGWALERVGDVEVAAFMRERLRVPEGSARRLAELQLPLSLMARLQGSVDSQASLVLRDGFGRARAVRLARRAVEGEMVRFGHLPPQLVRFESERFADARGCIGVVRFNVWMTPVMPRIDDAMVEFQRCRGVVIDLRGNVGGVAAMVMGIGGYFMDSVASLGTMTTRTGTLRYVANPRQSDRHGRQLAPFAGAVAILVDGLSVSTSEIFAAALQTLGRARVFGEASAGQALPAMLAQLPNGDIMQYVVADFVAPDGRRIEARGVMPDVRLPLRKGALLAGRDEPLLAAMAWVDERTATASAPSLVRRPLHQR